MTVTAAELLDKAAEVIGWCRHVMHDIKGRHCLVGGMQSALRCLGGELIWYHKDPTFQSARNTLVDFLDEQLVTWNDEKAIDGADVVNHLRKAAEIARSAGGEDSLHTTRDASHLVGGAS